MKPFSESCEQNRQPIFSVISPLLKDCQRLLEIGSGTGQHAVYFSRDLPHLNWQTSDVGENHAGIVQWISESGLTNILPPLTLDTRHDSWPQQNYDAVFSANTCHIMHWPDVEAFIAGVGKVLQSGGRFMLYGPFNYNGSYTSDSNQRFDQWLKDRDPDSGIRDFEALDQLCKTAGLFLVEDFEMPVNNRLLYWQKS